MSRFMCGCFACRPYVDTERWARGRGPRPSDEDIRRTIHTLLVDITRVEADAARLHRDAYERGVKERIASIRERDT